MKKRPKISTYLLLAICLSLITSSCKKSDANDPIDIKDGDGNIYTSVVIGTQTWLGENLKTTKYNDGTSIPLVTDNAAWSNLTAPGYCWYNNDESTNKNKYGALYNWYAANSNKLCPVGWHIPSDEEWTTLSTNLGGDGFAGGKLKETGTAHWMSPNTDATDEKGFTALPGGSRNSNGTFYGIGTDGYWWSDEYNATYGWSRIIRNSSSSIYRENINKLLGFSVRCIKD